MSDLQHIRSDHHTPAKTRIVAENSPGRDRRVGCFDLGFARWLLVVGCVHTPEKTALQPLHPTVIWVDAYAPLEGDGTAERPLKRVPRSIPAGVTLRLRSGLYAGPFVLEEGARLEGRGEVVLTGEAGQTVVTASGAAVEGVSIQGGAIGLEASQRVVMARVRFSGQRRLAVAVHGQLTMSQAKLEATVEGIDGVGVDRGASLELWASHFSGGFRRAVWTEGGAIDLRSVSAAGAKTLVHAIDGTSRLSSLSSGQGSGPAFFFAGGSVVLEGAEIVGHEYSVQLARGVDAHLSFLKASGGMESCVSAVSAQLTLFRSTFSRCGPGGALSLLDSRSTTSEVEINSARDLGIFLSGGQAALRSVRIGGVTASGPSLGDALHVRDARVEGESLMVSDVEGSAVFATASAEVRLQVLEVERARHSTLFVERSARVTLGAVRVRGGGGPALVVPDAAYVRLDSLFVAGGSEPPVWADCGAGAEVELGRLESTVPQPRSRCVEIPHSK